VTLGGLIVFDVDEDTGAKSGFKDIQGQACSLGDMPLMTPNVRLCERDRACDRIPVCTSPGVSLHDKAKTHSSGKLLFACRIIPTAVSCSTLNYDAKNIRLSLRIDRRRKCPVTKTAALIRWVIDQEANQVRVLQHR